MKIFITIILIIVPTMYFGYQGQEAVMGLSIIAGAIAGAFLNLDKFERFSGAGFEAEMRKEVEKAVEEAYATIENLKELAKPLFGSIILSLTNEGRFFFGMPDFREKDRYKDQIIDVAKSLELYDGELFAQVEDYHKIHTWDLYDQFVTSIERSDNNEFKPLFSGLSQRDTLDFPTEDKLTEILNLNKINLEERSSNKLKTYLHYLKHKSFHGFE